MPQSSGHTIHASHIKAPRRRFGIRFWAAGYTNILSFKDGWRQCWVLAETVEGAGVTAGAGIEGGDLGAEEREAPRAAPGTMRGALAQQSVAGRADQYRQSASGGVFTAADLNINAKNRAAGAAFGGPSRESGPPGACPA